MRQAGFVALALRRTWCAGDILLRIVYAACEGQLPATASHVRGGRRLRYPLAAPGRIQVLGDGLRART